MQLLTLYRMENDYYTATVDEVDVADFLDESYLLNKPLLDFNGVEVEVECDTDEIGYFDRDLMAGVINNIVTKCRSLHKGSDPVSGRP